MTVEKSPEQADSIRTDQPGSSTEGSNSPPSAPEVGPLPAHSRDSINMVAALLLALLWFGVVMLSASLRPATPEVERALSWLFGGAAVLTGLGGLIWRHVLRMAAALDVSQQQIDRLAVTDSMTGVFNHSGFLNVLDRDLARSKRYGHMFSVMVMDIDFFRRINDGYGHGVGDKVIVSLSATIASTLRSVDFVGRVTGAGFALGLPDTTIEQAGLLAERLRERIASIEVPGSSGEHVRYTVSIGVAMQLGDDAGQLMSRANIALQQAKDQGRNRVVTDLGGAREVAASTAPRDAG